jgi:hypothetical protein
MMNLDIYIKGHIVSDDRFKCGDIIYVEGQFGWRRGKYKYYSLKPSDYSGKYPHHVHVCDVYFRYGGWNSAIYAICISETEFLATRIGNRTSFVDYDKLKKLLRLEESKME